MKVITATPRPSIFVVCPCMVFHATPQVELAIHMHTNYFIIRFIHNTFIVKTVIFG